MESEIASKTEKLDTISNRVSKIYALLKHNVNSNNILPKSGSISSTSSEQCSEVRFHYELHVHVMIVII